MKKFLKILKSIAVWVFLALMIAISFFALAALMVNRHQLAKGQGVAFVIFGFAAISGMAFLCIRWMCRAYGMRSTGMVFAGFALLVGLFYAEEDWRGWRAWQSFKHQSEAKGEKLDYASIIPPPVPDDQNFALTPVVASSYEAWLDNQGNQIDPQTHNPNAKIVNRMAMAVYGDDYGGKWFTNQANWAKGTVTDLKVWQNYYRALAARTNLFSVPPQPQSPAADVLQALSKYDLTIEELRRASRLPESRFPLHYNADHPFDISVMHLAATKLCLQMLALRTEAELEMGQSDKALDDIKLAFRVVDSVRQEPFLISHLVRIADLQIMLQPVYEGLARHRWSDAELAELERALGRFDFLADLQRSCRGERNSAISTIDYLRRHKDFHDLANMTGDFDDNADAANMWSGIFGATVYAFIPSGWFYLNEVNLGKINEEWALPMTDPINHQIFPKLAQEVELYRSSLPLRPWNYFVFMFMPSYSAAERKFGYTQSAVDLATVACALERYRLAHGNYPASLAAVSPKFIESLPNDVVGGQPLNYRRTDDGRFVLYSLGWNEVDDGGTAALTPSGRPDNSNGDWVWAY